MGMQFVSGDAGPEVMHVRNATLLNVIGHRAEHDGVIFVPAELSLDGSSFSSSFPLAGVARERIPAVLLRPIEGEFDVAWVRARFPSVFGVVPETTESEKALLSMGMVAIVDGSNEAVAFECTDYYGRTSLVFSDSETDEPLKLRVAAAFWGALLSEPEQLDDFEASVPHLGASIMLHFGCKNGELYTFETPE